MVYPHVWTVYRPNKDAGKYFLSSFITIFKTDLRGIPEIGLFPVLIHLGFSMKFTIQRVGGTPRSPWTTPSCFPWRRRGRRHQWHAPVGPALQLRDANLLQRSSHRLQVLMRMNTYILYIDTYIYIYMYIHLFMYCIHICAYLYNRTKQF